jgi:hypothetical protein
MTTADYITAEPLVDAIAEALGPGYRPVKNPLSDHAPRFAKIATSEGAVFNIEATCYGRRDHFRVSGDYPRSPLHGQLVYNSDGAPTIRVSIHKKPAQIARDIKRRFLPDFLKVWAFVQGRQQSAETAHQAKVATYHKACAAIGIQPEKIQRFGIGDFPIFLNGIQQGIIYGGCTINSSDRVKFDLSTNAETALRILSALILR